MSFRLTKAEKLKSRKLIEALFVDGLTITKPPLKVYYTPNLESEVSQVSFAVPKRNFKHAVDRNRIKRQLREVYRLNKQELLANNDVKFSFLFLYVGKASPRYESLETAMKFLLLKLSQ